MKFLKEIENANYLLLTEELIAPLGQVNLPSYAAPEGDKDDSPRHITWGSNGTSALLDSVQSQNNRIEPVFAKYPELVADIKVQYPNGTLLPLVQEPHRSAAPLIRDKFIAELKALKSGDATPLAKRNPTAFIFGLDARNMWVKLQRIITATITATGIARRPSGSSLSSNLDDETRQQLAEKTGMKPSEIGVDQVCTYTERSGTVDTSSATITRRVEFPLSLLDGYPQPLQHYLKGLALVALLYPVPLNLRSGTSLVRRSRTLEAFSDFGLSAKAINLDGAFDEALAYARASATVFGIGQPEILVVDTAAIAQTAKENTERKAVKKAAKSGIGKAATITA